MKKTTRIICAFAVCLVAAILFTACAKEDKEGGDELRYEMDITLADNVLSGRETVSFVNTYCDELSETVFHLYPNSYAENAAHAAYGDALDSYGGITVSSVKASDGSDCVYRIGEDGEYMTVEHTPVKRKGKLSFTMEFATTVPSGKLRLSHNGEDYSLSSFYPQIAVYDDGFRQDAFCRTGDPVFSSCASYDVTLQCDAKQVVASSLPVEETVTEGDKQTIRFAGENVRDVAFALSPDYNVLGEKVGETDVFFFYKGEEDAEKIVRTAANALTVFSETFGCYPYKTFSVAIVPFSAEGMEYSGLVYVSDESNNVTDTVIHETAHQWWYGMVGSDCINESYMDEGLTTFCSAYYYELSGDHERFESELAGIRRAYGCYERLQQKRKTDANLAMDKSIYEYTDYQYTMVQYYKGCMMFANLYELYGRDKFDKALRQYCEDNRFAIGGKEAFIAASKEHFGDIRGLMDGWIGERVVATTFAEE